MVITEKMMKKHPVKKPMRAVETGVWIVFCNRTPMPVHKSKKRRYIRMASESSILLSESEASTVAAA